jgi:hypothetical protein
MQLNATVCPVIGNKIFLSEIISKSPAYSFTWVKEWMQFSSCWVLIFEWQKMYEVR